MEDKLLGEMIQAVQSFLFAFFAWFFFSQMTLPQPEPKLSCVIQLAQPLAQLIQLLIICPWQKRKPTEKPHLQKDPSIHRTFAGWEMQHTSNISTAVNINQDYKHRAPSRYNFKPWQWSQHGEFPSFSLLLVFVLLPLTTHISVVNMQEQGITTSEDKTGAGTQETEFLQLNTFQRELKSTIRFYT